MLNKLNCGSSIKKKRFEEFFKFLFKNFINYQLQLTHMKKPTKKTLKNKKVNGVETKIKFYTKFFSETSKMNNVCLSTFFDPSWKFKSSKYSQNKMHKGMTIQYFSYLLQSKKFSIEFTKFLKTQIFDFYKFSVNKKLKTVFTNIKKKSLESPE